MPSQLVWLGIVLIIISLIAYVLGARGIAGMTAGVGRMVLIVGIVLGLIFVVLSMLRTA